MLTIKTHINESEQESSLMNATLHSATSNIACSIEIHPQYPSNLTSQYDVKTYLLDALTPLSDSGWTINAQIGLDRDSEDEFDNGERVNDEFPKNKVGMDAFIKSLPKGETANLEKACYSVDHHDDGTATYNDEGQAFYFYESLEDFAKEYFLGKTVPFKVSHYVGDRDDEGNITWLNDIVYEDHELDEEEDETCVYTKPCYETDLDKATDDLIARADAFDLLELLLARPDLTKNVQAFAWIKERNKELASGTD